MQRQEHIAQKALSRFLATLTHELKTPLHAMLASASLLKSEVDGRLSVEQKRQVETIDRNGNQLLELINQLLDYGSLSSGVRQARPVSCDMRELLEEIVSSIRPIAEKSGISIELETKDLGREFWSDPVLIRQAVMNLLSNAIKFSPEGGKIHCFTEELSDSSVRLSIADMGIGMSPEVLDSIFKDFYQIEGDDRRRFQGVGLGLALVRESIRLLGGSIEVKSERQRGSLFTLNFPSLYQQREQRKVALLESDNGVLLSLQEGLEAEGLETRVLELEQDFLQQLESLRPDLLIFDYESSQDQSFWEKLKQTDWGQALPCILLSTIDDAERRARGFSLGASDFVVKPFDINEVVTRVKIQLDGSRG